MKSDKQSAINFQDWIFETVLPQIRETGSYKMKYKISFYENEVKALKNENHQLFIRKENLKQKIRYLTNDFGFDGPLPNGGFLYIIEVSYYDNDGNLVIYSLIHFLYDNRENECTKLKIDILNNDMKMKTIIKRYFD